MTMSEYYWPSHAILLVGEGDFSFTLCLGLNFGSATNIVATTLDSYVELINKYKFAQDNLRILGVLGASVLHRVDATQMMSHPDLRHKKFHRIIYNFPHAGFHEKEDHPAMISMHRNLVRRFLQNASCMLYIDGEVHVNHKTTPPFDSWKIEDLGSECSLVCIGQDEFRIKDYPGYSNKRGSGERADESFPLGSCKTYRFRLCPAAVQYLVMRGDAIPQTCILPSTFHTLPPPPPPVVQCGPPWSQSASYDERGELKNYYASEYRRLFDRYRNHVDETFGETKYDCRHSVMEASRYGYEMYISNAEAGRSLSESTRILECGPPWSQPASYEERGELKNYYASEYRRLFDRYRNHVDETFGETKYDSRHSVMEALMYQQCRGREIIE